MTPSASHVTQPSHSAAIRCTSSALEEDPTWPSCRSTRTTRRRQDRAAVLREPRDQGGCQRRGATSSGYRSRYARSERRSAPSTRVLPMTHGIPAWRWRKRKHEPLYEQWAIGQRMPMAARRREDLVPRRRRSHLVREFGVAAQRTYELTHVSWSKLLSTVSGTGPSRSFSHPDRP
jgi:hypothetical protein